VLALVFSRSVHRSERELKLEGHGVMSKERFDPGMELYDEGAQRQMWTADGEFLEPGSNAPRSSRTYLSKSRSSDMLS
jgi:hypothetical protein